MSRNRAVAIVIHDGRLLVMFRKNESEYHTFPGGGIENDETNEQAAMREVYEETSLKVEVDRLIYQLHHKNGDIHYYFLCRYIDGTPAVQPGTNEYEDNQLGIDIHTPQWLPLGGISKVNLYPLEVRNRLVQDVETGFKEDVTHFNLEAV